ncbi:MAG: hypothetical protein WCD86_17000 [Ktedonobacteraceae bacterium]
MMAESSSLERLPVADLVQGARQETMLFLRKLPTDGSHAFELFRRALALRDDAAWAGLYDLYRIVVKSWVLQRASLIFIDDLDALVNETFAKFAQAIDARKWPDFSQARALLAYLKSCAGSVVADNWRFRQRWSRDDPLDTVEQGLFLDDPADTIVEQLAARDLWRVMCSAISSEEERLVLQIVIAQGEPPRELQQCYPVLFPTIDDVYRVKRNLLERLRRNRAVLAFVRQRDT